MLQSGAVKALALLLLAFVGAYADDIAAASTTGATSFRSESLQLFICARPCCRLPLVLTQRTQLCQPTIRPALMYMLLSMPAAAYKALVVSFCLSSHDRVCKSQLLLGAEQPPVYAHHFMV
jgi:hypothetical protein